MFTLLLLDTEWYPKNLTEHQSTEAVYMPFDAYI